ncbi:hypothetical protein P9847_02755 [Paenibacillus chibensis]|uniref:Hydrolase n=1 Tax=Paenibacillus chibensis TaxID=59846 RepID=A0ABU6PN46_9BACL|nr:hypothetical protein [Paenibacillus chibensis]MEC0373380.1 hypothetical protein [Paenibacillus chibensis]MED5016222.1 hypothetical protein [Paenibacillus chibensis]
MEQGKKRYYISVTHNLIQDVPGDSTEFEMMLTDDQVTDLRDRMNELIKDDEYTFRRAFVPYKSADHDDAMEEFDEKLIGLYAYLHQIGDEDTKRLIDEMNILPKLHQTDYHDDGYDGSPLNK